jgi:hypothetical protein
MPEETLELFSLPLTIVAIAILAGSAIWIFEHLIEGQVRKWTSFDSTHRPFWRG